MIILYGYMTIWFGLGIAGLIIGPRGDLAATRRNQALGVILTNASFVIVMVTTSWLVSGSWKAMQVLCLMVLPVSLISYVNIKYVKLCVVCGHFSYDNDWTGCMTSCRKCGAKLDVDKPDRGDSSLE